MKIFTKVSDVLNHSNAVKSQGKKLCLVPTMGALHDGHLSLVREAKKHCESVIATIFVNPVQFAAHEDFGEYPRTLNADLASLESLGVDAVFTPTETEIYPKGKPEAKDVVPNEFANILCGKSRPHFFHGVWVVVRRLFEITKPDVAIFGEKDFQQLFIIRQMAKKEGFEINIIGAEIVREKTGLAMSSRNKYLNDEQLIIAANLYHELKSLSEELKQGKNVDLSINNAKNNLISKGFDSVDYIEYRDSETLEVLNEYNKGSRLIAAAYLGNTRLIDNYGI